MTISFRDMMLPQRIKGFPWTSAPRFSTTIVTVANGGEHRNRNWKHPLRKFQAPEAIRCHEDIEDVLEFWMNTAGPHIAFPIRDPIDFASRRLIGPNTVPPIYLTDQPVGIGDGETRTFQLQKVYRYAEFEYTRPIFLPSVQTVLIGMNAKIPAIEDPDLPGGPYLVDIERVGGTITFDHAPMAGIVITAGFLFDVPVRFESDDSLGMILKSFSVDGVSDLAFEEVRPCFIGEES